MVSRPKLASSDVGCALGRGLLDKLEIFLPTPVTVSWLMEKCEQEGFNHEIKYKREKRPYLIIKIGTSVILKIKRSRKLS